MLGRSSGDSASNEQSPSSVGHEIAAQGRRVIGAQIVAGILAATGFGIAQGMWAAQSGLFGAFISVFAAVMLRRGVQRASQIAGQDPKTAMLTLYMGAVVRFVLVLILFGVGLAGLKLAPLPVIVGFGLTQLAYLVGMRRA